MDKTGEYNIPKFVDIGVWGKDKKKNSKTKEKFSLPGIVKSFFSKKNSPSKKTEQEEVKFPMLALRKTKLDKRERRFKKKAPDLRVLVLENTVLENISAIRNNYFKSTKH